MVQQRARFGKIQIVIEGHGSRVRMYVLRDQLERFARARGWRTDDGIGHKFEGRNHAAHNRSGRASALVERAVDVRQSGFGPAGFSMAEEGESKHRPTMPAAKQLGKSSAVTSIHQCEIVGHMSRAAPPPIVCISSGRG